MRAIAGALPLQEDFDEAEAVYGALCGLATNTETASKVSSFFPQLVQVKSLSSNFAYKPAGSCSLHVCCNVV